MAKTESIMPGITNLATKAILNTQATETENKIPDNTDFITSPEFNKIKKIFFDARMKEAAESLLSKIQVDTVLDLADKSREKWNKFQTFDLSYFIGNNVFDDNGS